MPNVQPQRLASLAGDAPSRALQAALRAQDAHNTAVAQALNAALVVGDTVQVWRPYTAASPLKVPTGWTALTLLNSWAQFDANTVNQYRKDATGVVWLQGRVKNGSAAGAVIATLPAGYRPAQQNNLFAVRGNAGWGSINITPDGNITGIESNTTDMSLTCSFPCADFSPAVPSCFPFDLAWPKPYAPTFVVAQAQDVSNAASPTNLAMGLTDWTTVVQGGQTFVRVRNMPGLLPGTNYAVQVWGF